MKNYKFLLVFVAVISIISMGYAFAPGQAGDPPTNPQFSEPTYQEGSTFNFSYSDFRTECLDEAGDICMTMAVCDQTQEVVIIKDVTGTSNMAVWWDTKGDPVLYWDDLGKNSHTTFNYSGHEITINRGIGEYIPAKVYMALQSTWQDISNEAQFEKQSYNQHNDPGWEYIHDIPLSLRNALEDYISQEINRQITAC